jgi:outer membrane protein
LNVPLSDYVFRLTHAAAASSATREAAERALAAEKLAVENIAHILYYNWLRANGQVFITRKALERNQARLADARAAHEVGTISRADLYRVEALVAMTELAVTQAIALQKLANTQLAIVMEDRKAPAYRIGETIQLPPPIVVDESQTRLLIAQAMRKRLELKAIDASKRSLHRGADAVRAGGYPRLDAFGDVTYANPNQRVFPQTQEWNASWAVGVSATWNIDNLFLNDASADELDANARALFAQRRALEAAITQQVVAAHLDVAKAQAALHANETSLKAAQESYRVRTDLFRAGQATTSDLIEAEEELLNAKLAAVDARIDLVIATLALRHASGSDVKSR